MHDFLYEHYIMHDINFMQSECLVLQTYTCSAVIVCLSRIVLGFFFGDSSFLEVLRVETFPLH